MMGCMLRWRLLILLWTCEMGWVRLGRWYRLLMASVRGSLVFWGDGTNRASHLVRLLRDIL